MLRDAGIGLGHDNIEAASSVTGVRGKLPRIANPHRLRRPIGLLIKIGILGRPAAWREIVDAFLAPSLPPRIRLRNKIGEDLGLRVFEAELIAQLMGQIEGN